MDGARKLDGVDDSASPVGKPVGALGLAAAAVSSLQLYSTSLIRYTLL